MRNAHEDRTGLAGVEARWPRETWYPLLESRRVGSQPVGVTRLGQRLVLWRGGGGQVVAQPARCPHRGADLAKGRVVEGTLECPYHGFRFSAQGECVRIPCEGSRRPIRQGLELQSFPVREEHGLVWLWWGEPRAELPPVPWFSELPADWRAGSTRTLDWQVPFVQAMEGNLDIHHLPFAHRRVAWSAGELLEPYEARVEGPLIRTRGVLRKDDGKPYSGRGGWELELSVLFPNLVLGRFGERTQAVVAVCPVDEQNTWIAFRYHVGVPVVGRLLAWAAASLEMALVQPDDHEVLRGSQPRPPTLEDHKLVRADAGIALWHKLYHQHMQAQAHAQRATLEAEQAAPGANLGRLEQPLHAAVAADNH